MKIKKWICCTFSVLLILSLLGPILSYGADERDKLNKLNSEINKLQTKLRNGRVEENKLASQIKNLDGLIEEAECEIRDLQGEITRINKEITQVESKMEAKKKEIDNQNSEMGSRIRAMYKNGDVGILEVVLGSTSITDFLTNLDMAQKIFDNDVALLEQLENQHKIIKDQKDRLDQLKKNLDAKKQAEASKQGQLQISRGDVSQLKAEVAGDNKVLEKQVDALNQEANALVAEILRLQGTEEYVGGVLGWPAPSSKRITSEFGYRLHPTLNVNKLHTGMDIGVPTGSQIVAANAGKVIKAAWNNSYGYMVMIDHGGGIVTLYAHNSQLKVKTGDVVARGQLIALSGSTGVSTGPHLHFEVRVNGEYKNPRAYL